MIDRRIKKKYAVKNCYTEPVWAVGFALEQTLHVVALAVFSYVDFKVDKVDSA
jgi:hypothetical protein